MFKTGIRRWGSGWAASLAVAVALGAGMPAAAPARTDPVAVVACVSATIGGHHKCIAAGQYCARRHERDYERYGYKCTKRDYSGRYHLLRR